MGDIVRYPGRSGKWLARRPRLALPAYWQRYAPRSGVSIWTAIFVWMLVAAIAAGFHALTDSGALERIIASNFPPAKMEVRSEGDTLIASFSLCSGSFRVNCVVDGDTFWYKSTKIRIADIDTPELSPPRCAHEAQLGEAAKRRLLALLNAGHFSLVKGWRDEDRYGRKLRTVNRNGRSLGDTLIAEGLARQWDGARHGWCS